MSTTIDPYPVQEFEDPIELLRGEHRRIGRLLGAERQIIESHRGRSLEPEARALLREARRRLLVACCFHDADEQQSLLPRLRDAEVPRELRRSINAILTEQVATETLHAQAATLVRRWLDADDLSPADTDRLLELLRRLADQTRQHARQTEGQVFPVARRVLSPDQMREMACEMADRRGQPPPGDGKGKFE